jgi:hypothetical protein
VGEHGVRKGTTGAQEHNEKDSHRANRPSGPAMGSGALRGPRLNPVF